MTPTQYQRMRDRVDLYAQLRAARERLEGELASFREHGPKGFNVEFVGISCRVCLFLQTSEAMLPEIEKVYMRQIADCVRDMQNIDTEIGN